MCSRRTGSEFLFAPLRDHSLSLHRVHHSIPLPFSSFLSSFQPVAKNTRGITGQRATTRTRFVSQGSQPHTPLAQEGPFDSRLLFVADTDSSESRAYELIVEIWTSVYSLMILGSDSERTGTF